jgi:hypothetical protein
MRKVKFIAWAFLLVISYITPQISPAQTTIAYATNQQSAALPLGKALQKVTEVFHTQFVYEQLLVEGKTVSYNEEALSGKTVEEVLKELLYPNGLIFLYVKENYYSIVSKDRFQENKRAVKESCEASYTALLSEKEKQDLNITGRVTDSLGNPMAGVSVNVDGTASGTITDSNGEYSISVPENAVLVFSYVGFATQQIPVNGQSTVNVQLSSKEGQLQAVVVSALGVVKSAKSITYATQNVSGEEVTKVKDPNFMNTLAGKAAGVVITKGGAGPGSSSRILLRGNKSIVGNNSPLYVIDGVPMNNAMGIQTSSLY